MSPTAANRTPPSSDELFSPSLIDQSVQDSLPPNHTLRPLNRNDYHKGYLENLKSLTWVGDVSHTQFLEHFDWMKSRDGWFYNVVVEHEGRIVGNGVLIVERKFIWGLGRVGHIEEICIADDHQNSGLGRAVVKALDFIAVEEGCQRSILDCGLGKTEYYMKSGYKTVGIQMARDWPQNKPQLSS